MLCFEPPQKWIDVDSASRLATFVKATCLRWGSRHMRTRSKSSRHWLRSSKRKPSRNGGRHPQREHARQSSRQEERGRTDRTHHFLDPPTPKAPLGDSSGSTTIQCCRRLPPSADAAAPREAPSRSRRRQTHRTFTPTASAPPSAAATTTRSVPSQLVHQAAASYHARPDTLGGRRACSSREPAHQGVHDARGAVDTVAGELPGRRSQMDGRTRKARLDRIRNTTLDIKKPRSTRRRRTTSRHPRTCSQAATRRLRPAPMRRMRGSGLGSRTSRQATRTTMTARAVSGWTFDVTSAEEIAEDGARAGARIW